MSGRAPDRPAAALPPPGVARPGAVPRLLLPPSRRRRPPTPGELARRRWVVRAARWLLPALAMALLTMIAFWPEIDGQGENSRVSFRRTVQPRGEALRVVDPHYQGVDELNRPYTITARTGQQQGAARVLDLDQPRADIVLSDGAWVYLRADSGRYDRDAQRLDLRGAVTLYHDNGTMLHTDSAVVRLDQGSAAGDAPVAAQGPFGTLVSEGFRLTERGQHVVFTGRARTVLESER